METIRFVLLAIACSLVGGVQANTVAVAAPAVAFRDVLRGGPAGRLPPRIKLEHPKGGCLEIAPHGAHLLSWKIPAHSEIIYLSPQAKFGENDGIRGGTSICFPQYCFRQFGAKGPLPLHSFSCQSNDWTLERGDNDESKVTFVLKDTEVTRKSAWPHPFELSYEISFDPAGELLTKMTVRNVGKTDFEFTCALHTYFCGDMKEMRIEGLKGVEYEDALDKAQPVKVETHTILSLDGNVDRLYGPTPLELRIVDAKKGRSITIAKDFPDVIVWNPSDTNKKALGDLPEDDFNKFVCVEVGAIRKPVKVKAGGVWSASQKYTVGGS